MKALQKNHFTSLSHELTVLVSNPGVPWLQLPWANQVVSGAKKVVLKRWIEVENWSWRIGLYFSGLNKLRFVI